MSRHACPITLELAEWTELQRRIRARTSSQQAALRAEIVLQASSGAQNTEIAAALGIARHAVQHWRTRFAAERLAGLEDRPHCPPPRRYGPECQAAIVLLACQSPKSLGWAGQTHWSVVDLAQYIAEHPELGLGTPSKSTIGVILQAHKLRLDRL
jgi:DNA-binding CsgD family transcriptional regulator